MSNLITVTDAMNGALKELWRILSHDEAVAFVTKAGNDHERLRLVLLKQGHMQPHQALAELPLELLVRAIAVEAMEDFIDMYGDAYSWDPQRVSRGADKMRTLSAEQMAEGELLNLMADRRDKNRAS